ncbi:MAG: TetR family transcriptional regulator [Proteobacteria bacterium]|nr:TetR family transcriptional regulator [Pseudomonadota bacterium]
MPGKPGSGKSVRRKSELGAARSAAVASESPWARPRRRSREREIKRDAVILTAARAFQRRGYHNTSLDDLAALLGVTKPTLYHYVTNKEEILFECFRTGLDQIRAGLREADASDAPARDRLALVVRRYAAAITSDFGWCMVRAEDQDLSHEMGAAIKALKSEIDQGLRRLLRAGIGDGSIAIATEPKLTAFALAGALNWMGHWYRAGEALSSDEVAEGFMVLFGVGPATKAQRGRYNGRSKTAQSSGRKE